MKTKLFIFFLALALVGCTNQTSTETKVSNPADYDKFLASNEPKTTSPYFELWNSKITEDSIQLPSFTAVAGQYNLFFESTGDIEYLKKAEKSLEKAVEIANIDREKYYRSLARNYISQHRFKEAKKYADSAASMGPEITANQHLLFDVYMELGNYKQADSILKLFADPYDFGYMIRAAKWNDYKGDLDRTIMFMEKAKEKAEASNNRDMLLWVYSNLADYYGHAGRIEDSYKHYLKTLEIEPSNAYSKKGIAWIVYSHEKNDKEALRILDSILVSHISPDIYLLKAEIADFNGDQELYKESTRNYKKLAQNTAYGDMYNVYDLKMLLSEKGNEIQAINLAKREISNRETPESYHLLAMAYLRNNNKTKALEIIRNKVEEKTFEPEAQLSMAKIYKANNLPDRVKKLKAELLDAKYELGPVTHKTVQSL